MGKLRFILIDDDPLCHTINTMTIEVIIGKTDVISFVNPKVGFDYIHSQFASAKGDAVILLLDLNMPIMSGWEFLERFDNLTAKTKSSISLYILSSSIDEKDKKRSYANKNVKGFLLKPLSVDSIQEMLATHSLTQ